MKLVWSLSAGSCHSSYRPALSACQRSVPMIAATPRRPAAVTNERAFRRLNPRPVSRLAARSPYVPSRPHVSRLERRARREAQRHQIDLMKSDDLRRRSVFANAGAGESGCPRGIRHQSSSRAIFALHRVQRDTLRTVPGQLNWQSSELSIRKVPVRIRPPGPRTFEGPPRGGPSGNSTQRTVHLEDTALRRASFRTLGQPTGNVAGVAGSAGLDSCHAAG
jgi:hypothetical protein